MRSKPRIRFTLFEILPNIIIKDTQNLKKASGVVGTLVQKLFEKSLYKSFNYSINWVEDGGGIGKNTNGTYEGLLGMLHRNETDSCPLLYYMFVFDGSVRYSFPTLAMDGRILNSPCAKTTPVDLLTCYQSFSTNVWLSILILTGITFFMIIKLMKANLCDAISDTFGLLLNKKLLIIKRPLFQMIVIGSVILVTAFVQSMNANLMKKDYSTIIDSISDLATQSNVRPVFIDDGAIVSLFENGASPTYAKMWERAKKVGNRNLYVFKMNPTEYNRAVRGGGRIALISTEPIVKIAASFGCQKDPKRRSWIARKPLQETQLGFYMNVNLSEESVRIINDMSHYFIEGGHDGYIWNFAGDNVVKDLLPGAGEPFCIKQNIQDLFVETENSKSIRLSNMTYFYFGFGLLLLLSFALFILESATYRLSDLQTLWSCILPYHFNN